MRERYTTEGTAEMARLDKSKWYMILGDIYWWNPPSESWMSDTCPFMLGDERMAYYVAQIRQGAKSEVPA